MLSEVALLRQNDYIVISSGVVCGTGRRVAKINLERRAKIGRERRARTRVQIIEAAAMLLAERSGKALTVDAVAEAAGVAKGTF